MLDLCSNTKDLYIYYLNMMFVYFTLLLVGVRSIVISVSVGLSVCPSARMCEKLHVQISSNFLYMWPWLNPHRGLDLVAIRGLH